MCRVAVEGDSLFEVSDIELKRAGPSYTLDTVLALKSAGRQDIHWLIGADMLQMLPKWHRAEELVREATILVMARPGFEFDWALLPAAFAGLRHNIVEAPLVDISATEIRRRVRAGLDISELTPPAVVRYIQQRGLYR